jgi:hypothetical protein
MLEGFLVNATNAFMNTSEQNNEAHNENGSPDEGFAPMYAPAMNVQNDLAGMIGRVLALLLVLLLISFFGQYFWNNYVTSLFTVTKPAKSVMQILGLFIFMRLMFP